MQVESIPDEQVKRSCRTLHLLYHELRSTRSRYSYVIDEEEFKRHVDLLVKMRKSETSSFWPELTFDDGHISNLSHALPILQSRGLIARFFITVGWTGQKSGYMDWGELRSLHESGQLLGAHGWSHILLTHCAKEDLDQELRRPRLLLEDKLGSSITTMSLPGGRYNRRVLAACEEAGYSRVFTSEPKAEDVRSGLKTGRLNMRGDMKIEWVRDLLQSGSPALSNLERRYKVKLAVQRLLGDGLYEKVWSVLNGKEPETADSGGGRA